MPSPTTRWMCTTQPTWTTEAGADRDPDPVRWWAFWLLVLMAGPLAWLVFIADSWTVNRVVVAIWSVAQELGLPGSLLDWDGFLNGIMLLPAALLAALWLPRVRWWVWALAGFGTTVAIESVQFFTPRDASVYDIAFNSLGALVGALAGAAANAALGRRRSALVEGPVGVLGQEPGGDHGYGEHQPEQREQDR